MKKALITQSNYIPWKGFFDSIKSTDVFVVYDDMQYTKRDWRNRNLIKTSQGLKWLSIPVEVKGKYFQKIKDTKIVDKSWAKSHWNILKENYKAASHYKETESWLEAVYLNCDLEYLTDVNLLFINAISNFLGINTNILSSSQFKLDEDKTMRLVNICKDIHATDYYSGPAAQAYMEENKFKVNGINVHYWDYGGYREYDQLYPPFEHGVSILDLIFSTGTQAVNFMKQ